MMVYRLLKKSLKNNLKVCVAKFLSSRGFTLRRLPTYQSETSKCRHRLGKYCIGNGVDVGFGGDPINDTAIRIDLPSPYACAGHYGVQLGGDATSLYWFNDNVLDYVFSSHLLEDFDDVEAVCREWLRVLKPGGKLVIFCPDEKAYREHCLRLGHELNPHHKHGNFSLDFVMALLANIGCCNIVHQKNLVDIYSWELVAEKTSA